MHHNIFAGGGSKWKVLSRIFSAWLRVTFWMLQVTWYVPAYHASTGVLKYSNNLQPHPKVVVAVLDIKNYQKIQVEFVDEKIHAYPFIFILYLSISYLYYRNSSVTKKTAIWLLDVLHIFTYQTIV